MMVGRGRVSDHLAARIARHHHRDFGLEIQALLGHAGLLPQRPPGIARPLSLRPIQLHLPPAVVTAVGPFEINPRPQLRHRLQQILFRINAR